MKSGSVKVLSVLILILAIIIGGYLTFSLVLASIGIEIISMGVFVFFILQALAAIMENLENINYNTKRLVDMQSAAAHAPESSGRTASSQNVRNVGNTWTCPECGTVNPITVRNCKGCGRDK